MKQKALRTIALTSLALVVMLAAAWQAQAQAEREMTQSGLNGWSASRARSFGSQPPHRPRWARSPLPVRGSERA